MPKEYLFYYIAAINIIALVMMGIDKSIAVKNGQKKPRSKKSKETSRIPEATLIMLAVMMGSVGSFFGMQIFRHKTKHLKFVIGVPLCFIFNCIIVYFMYKLQMVI